MTDDLVEAVATEIWHARSVHFGEADKTFIKDERWELCVTYARAAIAAHKSAIEAQGLRIVPVEPTDRMIDAGHEKVICPAYVNAELCEAEDVWSAMIDAAPKHTALSPRDDRAVTDNGRDAVIEECARIAESHQTGGYGRYAQGNDDAARDIAADIRDLSKDRGEAHTTPTAAAPKVK